MELLSRTFLKQIAEERFFSPEQAEAFIALFSTEDSVEKVAASLNISRSAFSSRMTQVYKQFGYREPEPNKRRKLQDFLYQKLNDNPKNIPVIDPPINIDSLVKEIRKKIRPYIKEECGTMKVLTMSQPIDLNEIYTNVNILEQITGGRNSNTIDRILENFDPELEDFDRCGLGKRIDEKTIPGLEAVNNYPKLMVLGKPGAGKTTFLKHIAMQCCFGNFMSDRVPIFITLKEFAEDKNKRNLKSYIVDIFTRSGIAESEIREILIQGKALILLDGLDEVREEDSKRVKEEIENLAYKYIKPGDRSYLLKEPKVEVLPEFEKDESVYSAANMLGSSCSCEIEPKIDYSNTNSFVITCRIAANEYIFEKFTDVEIADFDDRQIKTFVTNWFKCSQFYLKNGVDRFMKKLRETPQIKELATNPLLLTLLCLEFEDSGDFPKNRSELYERGIDTLLRKWDLQRAIERDDIYKNLSTRRKENLLSQIAAKTFENKNYFFKKRLVSRYISNYIQNLPAAKTDPEALEIDSDRVLKSIEAQHGLLVERARDVYSFSHLTFQEYFTANKFISSCNPYSLEDPNLRFLASKILEKRWREVLILAVEMLDSADFLLKLMKQQVDLFIADDDKLQQVLKWIKKRHNSLKISYHPIEILEILYIDFVPSQLKIENPLKGLGLSWTGIFSNLEGDLTIHISLSCIDKLTFFPSQDYHKLAFLLLAGLDRTINNVSDLDFKNSLIEFKSQLPNLDMEEQSFINSWKNNGKKWYKQLKEIAIKYRDIGHDWQFNEEEKTKLKKYSDANKLLWEWIETTKSDRCYLTREVRAELKNTLLWPIEDI